MSTDPPPIPPTPPSSPRQNKGGDGSLGRLLHEARLARGMTLRELAEASGCAKSYLSSIENQTRAGGGAPSEALLERIERALGMEAGTLVRAADWQVTPATVRRHVQALEGAQQAAAVQLRRLLAQEGATGAGSLDELWKSGKLRGVIERLTGPIEVEGVVRSAEAKVPGDKDPGTRVTLASVLPVEVPLINSVAAGYPTEFTDLSYPARVADEYVRTPDIHDPDAFAARVVGTSMQPEYREGDIVVFSPAKIIKDGMDCFVRLEPDHETTFKRVYFQTDDGGQEWIRLQPLNPAFAAREVQREMVAGLYAAVSVTRVV